MIKSGKPSLRHTGKLEKTITGTHSGNAACDERRDFVMNINN